MLIIRMTGGMGNQMFQYALYLKLCSMGREVKFDDKTEYEKDNARPIMLWSFGLGDYPKATRDEINAVTDGFLKITHRVRRKLFGRRSLEYHEKDCNFDPAILEKETAYLTGYFQTEKYFKDIEKQVRSAFTFCPAIYGGLSEKQAQAVHFYKEKIESCFSVSIHIRRGDYLESSEIYGGNCTEKYYEKAVSLIRERYPEAVFFVFCNEEEWSADWCRQQKERWGQDFVNIEGMPEEKGYLAMMLMSRCRSHIIANSSFSWWGAWLNPYREKCVIAPGGWFNNQICRDIYTEEMLRVSPEGTVLS